MIKNTAGQGVYVYAVTTATGVALEGDAANITATISKDGAADGATNDVNPTEIGGGIYWFDFTQAETNADSIALIPVSATSGVVLDPVTIETTTASSGTTPAAVWAYVLEDSMGADELMRLILSAVAGLTSGGGIVFRDAADTKPRITATVDGSGNRTAITLDGT